MAALAGITAVRPTVDTRFSRVQYGATISAGQSIYLDSADNKWKLADCNAGSAAVAACAGVAITPGIADGHGIIATGGSIILVGTTMAVGTSYAVGQTAGSLVPESDLTTSDYLSKVGSGSTTTQMLLGISATGILHA